MKIKRIITTILMAALLLGIMPFTAYAKWGEGNTLDDALSQLDVGFADKQLDWLYLPGLGVVKQRYTYYYYNNQRTGQIEERPVFCIDPTRGGAHEIVASIGPDSNGDNVATYLRGDKVGDARYKAILFAGYPHMQLNSLGLQTHEEGYYATKLALWMYIRGNDSTKLTINPAYGDSNPVALRVRQAAVNIYNNSATFPVREPQLTMTGKPSPTANLDASGQYYVQGIEVYASGWIGDNPAASGDVQLTWSSPPPAGTIVLGTDDEDITSSLAVKMNAVENVGRFGTVTLKYPAATVEEDFSPPTLNAKALLPNDGVYVAYAQAGKDKYQRYLVEDDPKIIVTASFVSQVGKEWVDDFPTDTGLRIRKVEAGTNTPLAGAVFEVRDPEGKLIYSLATPASGIIDIPLAVMGNYTVTETTPPQHHLLPEQRTQSVTVRYGEVAEVTFTNAPYGTLRVSKYDAANGRPLSGAAIQIRNILTNTTQESRTDSSGKVVFTKLPVGAYEIIEIASPDGYALDSSAHTVNVVSLSEGETSYTLTNKALPGLRIIKFDRQTMTPIEGITFDIWHDGELYGTFTTDAWGEIELRNIPAGTYTAREVATVSPYVLDPTAQWIEIKAGQGYISELIFFNLVKPGISLVKIDSETFVPLVNARFLIKQVGGSFAKEYTTDANGEINLSELEPGAYTVEEITAPSGYLIDDAIRTIQINAGENAQFVFTNTLKPVLEILKFDGENYIPGAAFRIAKIADGSHYLDRISDENGRIRIEGLEPGIYSVKEMQPPPGYVPNETEYHVELFPGKTSQLVVVNIKKPSLIVWKYDEQTAKPLPDTEFSIAKKGGSIIYEGITNSEGFIRLIDLDEGWYTITELAPPPGYLPGNPSTKDVYLEPGKTVEIKFDNIRKPTLVFLKTNAVTGKGIPGATFKVEYETPGGGLKTIGSFKTGSDGRIIIPQVEPGWYVLTETMPAPGFSLPKNPVTRMYVEAGQNAYLAEFAHYYSGGAEQGADNSLSADSSSTAGQIGEHSGSEFYIEGEGFNWPLNSIVIKKTHAITGELLAGAAFELYRADEQVSGIPGTNIGRYTTNNSGVVVITGLEPGYYMVKEVQAPQNFLLSENSQQNGFLKADGTTVLEFTFANYPYGGLLITKVDAQTNKPLAGARFRVTDSSGAVVGTANGEYTTDSQGEIHIPNIKPGSYVVTEIAAPAGYAIDSTPQTVKVGTDGGIYRLSFRNQPDGGLQIIKLNSTTRQPIEGVEFAVSHMNGERVGSYRSDKSGLITLPGLTPGWYTVSEVKAANGYILDAEPRNVEVKQGKTTTLEITNTQLAGLRVIKIDSISKKPIYNVEFMVFDMNNKVVGTYYTDNNGVIDFAGILPEGRYSIRETRAAAGYYLDEIPKTIELVAGKMTEIRWENVPQMGQIQITKKSGDDNEVNGLPAGTPLADAIFEVYEYKSGNLVDRFVSGTDGRAVSKPLPLGRYTLKEVQAPQWYRLSPETADIEIEFATQIIKRDFVNYSANTGVSIRKTGNQEAQPGDEIRYIIKEVRNTSTVQLTDFYWRDVLPTDAVRLTKIVTGTYNQSLQYKVMATTNRGDSIILADNLSSTRNNVVDCSGIALGLSNDEYITSFTLVFGTVKAGFAQVEQPQIFVKVLPTLPNAYQFANKADVGGKYGSEWVVGNSTWLTTVYAKPVKLPRTGY